MTEQAEGKTEERADRQLREWIEYPKKKAEILRQKAREAGEDADNILLGHILNVIIGDDVSAFHSAVYGGYIPEELRYSQTKILGRLSLEIKFKQTPKNLKKQLELVRDKLKKHNWGDKESFEEAYETWKEEVQDWTLNFRNTNPKMKEAYEKFLSFDNDLSRAYAKKV